MLPTLQQPSLHIFMEDWFRRDLPKELPKKPRPLSAAPATEEVQSTTKLWPPTVWGSEKILLNCRKFFVRLPVPENLRAALAALKPAQKSTLLLKIFFLAMPFSASRKWFILNGRKIRDKTFLQKPTFILQIFLQNVPTPCRQMKNRKATITYSLFV